MKTKKIGKAFRKLDQYGHPIGVNYDGGDTYQTKAGACATIVKFLIIGFYSTIKLLMWVFRTNQEERSLQIQVNIEESGTIDLLDNNLPMSYYFVGRSNDGYEEYALEVPGRIASMLLVMLDVTDFG